MSYEPEPRLLRFRIMTGPRAGQNLELPLPIPTTPLLLGRLREAAISIDGTDVSRRHAEIFLGSDANLYIQDLGSRNGTQVNGVSATRSAPLRLTPGSIINISGSQIVFEGVFNALAAVRAPEPPLLTQSPSPSVTTPPLGLEAYAYLVLRSNGQRFKLEGPEVGVGRVAPSQIIIDARSISRQHALLQQSGVVWTLTDLGSTNKTFVNNQPVTSSVALRNNDIIRFGDIETIFLLESQRLTQSFDLQVDEIDMTARDSTNMVDYHNQSEVAPSRVDEARRRNLQQGETRLDLDVRDLKKSK